LYEVSEWVEKSHIIVPAVNTAADWQRSSTQRTGQVLTNLKVNPTKYMEIIFVDKRRKGNAQTPPSWGHNNKQSVRRRTHTHNNQFVLSDFYIYSHVIDDSELQTVFRSVVIAKLQYMHPVRCGDSLQSDIVLIHSFVTVHDVVLFHLTRCHLKLSAAQPTKNCLRT